MDGGNYYGEFITNFDTMCKRSIVRIRAHYQGGSYIRTGVVIASSDKSCWVITTHQITEDCEVEFFDGTRAVANSRFVKICNDFKMGSIPIIGLDGVHWEVATFSQNEAVLGQRVFTLGYNRDNARTFNQTKDDGTTVTGNFISGNLVSRAGIKTKEFERAVVFVHACATGNNGHMGSAVFNDTARLVGVNFFHTTTKGVDYESDRPEGGLVAAIDLETIKHGFEAMYPLAQVMNKSLPEIVQSLGAFLRNIEVREAGGHA